MAIPPTPAPTPQPIIAPVPVAPPPVAPPPPAPVPAPVPAPAPAPAAAASTTPSLTNQKLTTKELIAKARRMNLEKNHAKLAQITKTFKNTFFFQTEDGIRDYKVTGVQTCALPI